MSDTDSGTGSESEKEATHNLELMTKHDIQRHVRKSGCKMLAGLNMRYMTKEVLIEHLVKIKCPELMKIMHPKK
jgi:hypothetical protein